jgi:hypothetical protein
MPLACGSMVLFIFMLVFFALWAKKTNKGFNIRGLRMF